MYMNSYRVEFNLFDGSLLIKIYKCSRRVGGGLVVNA